MYLKYFELINFRKFGTENNRVEFVSSKSNKDQNKVDKIDVASSTTLIVGKNNSGKTTIIKALVKLLENKKITANDFNFYYLKDLLVFYKGVFLNTNDEIEEEEIEKIETPYLKFKVGIGIENVTSDYVTNLVPFLRIVDLNSNELEIIIKVEVSERQTFFKNLRELLIKSKGNNKTIFRSFLDLINDTDFKLKYFDANGEVVEDFKLKDLIELKPINANIIKGEKSLSNAFNKIIRYRQKELVKEGEKEFDAHISNINAEITKMIEDKHTNDINKSIKKIESPSKFKVHLGSYLTFESMLSDVIKYEFVEQGLHIPEDQFGLGYTNLMMIIAELIEYMEKHPNSSFNSKINLISIEEPETYMHPQMQELFIKNINEAIDSLLESKKNKRINSQLIITTHSSHILNSKIHSGNSFDNINYVTVKDKFARVITLNDEKVAPDNSSNDSKKENKKEKDKIEDAYLKFLKKHIKYKVSELFFSDAIIFVEGVTEETLLKYYIESDERLNKYYISIFNIDGAHGLVYHNLIKILKVPALIITDLDIKREEHEKDNKKDNFIQISSLENRITTNETIKKYNGSNRLGKIHKNLEHFRKENMYIAFQGKINGYYATSFEEAFILTNYNNSVLNTVLKKMKPSIYKDIVGENENNENIRESSFKLQMKLSNDKSNFANEMLFALINVADQSKLPSLPEYISQGLDWLSEQLEGEMN